ncbi:MAG: ribosome maturation factor RimP [Alphaproteobacteria bacterium]
MDITEKIRGIVEPSLESMGYAIVLIKLADAKHRKTLTVMAERNDGKQMSFDDCTEISHTIGALLEVEDPISGAYNLEVCSPGIDRPLTKKEDYVRFNGYEAKLETQLPIDGRKRFRGIIQGADNTQVRLHVEGQQMSIPLGNIRTAKLVMNDALVAEFMKKAKPA